jgi:heme/copper-type cytochrome/quinol oxidase subunit 1
VEAIAVLLLPGMLGTRDMPFPRLSAFGYWSYAFGGVLVFASLFIGVAPDGGWFMYPPLTGPTYSPGVNTDVWVLGLGFVEISAVAAAVELIVGILKTRAPGMTLAIMPIFAWYMLVTAAMIMIGMPAVIAADVLLELERGFGLPFYDATRGGDPLLWQHLFWLFGHPEVYIIFLPSAGIVSTIIPTFARTPLVGHTWVVLAAIAVGFLSFGLWVHHMFTTGLPLLSLAFFSAASSAIAIPMGIQVFAWIATMWGGKPALRVPMLFVLGVLFIFTIGGLTGVMVASVPYDWQVHDTHFVVAHLHYVLMGGMVFPVFAALYYWMPILRPDAVRGAREARVLAHVHRLQRGVPADARDGPPRDAAAGLHVSGGHRLDRAQSLVLGLLVRAGRGRPRVRRRLRPPSARGADGGNGSVGRAVARMGVRSHRLRIPQHRAHRVAVSALGPPEPRGGFRSGARVSAGRADRRA